MWRFTPPVDANAPLAEYHQRFLDRYGTHRLVPLNEVVHPTAGLGRPRFAPKPYRPVFAHRPDHEAALADLLARARDNEVELSGTDIARLDWGHDAAPRPSADLHVWPVTDSPDHLARGDYQLAVVPWAGGWQAEGAAARLAHALGIEHVPEPDGTLEISARTLHLAGDGLADSRPRRPRLCVDVPAEPGDVPLDDLSVGATRGRLYAYSTSLGRTVTPILRSRVSQLNTAPLVRLLLGLGQWHTLGWRHWRWGNAHDILPQAPRLRHGQIILAPARWTVPAPVRDTRTPGWRQRLARWRAQAAVPRHVMIEDRDRLLPIDLDHPPHADQLRRALRGEVTAVIEPPAGRPLTGWLPGPTGRHAVELVVPLRATAQPPDPTAARRRRPTGADVDLPGGAWISVELPCPAQWHTQVIARLRALPPLRDRTWFYVRYRNDDSGSHLRLRIRTARGEHDRVLRGVRLWAERLRTETLVGPMLLRAYERETERYGGPEAIEQAEEVFCADSRLALRLLADSTHPPIVWAAAALHDLADLADGTWPLSRPRLDAGQRRLVAQHRSAVRALPPQRLVSAEWTARRTAARVLLDRIDGEASSVTASVGHMTCNRLALSESEEQAALILAYDAHRSRTADRAPAVQSPRG